MTFEEAKTILDGLSLEDVSSLGREYFLTFTGKETFSKFDYVEKGLEILGLPVQEKVMINVIFSKSLPPQKAVLLEGIYSYSRIVKTDECYWMRVFFLEDKK